MPARRTATGHKKRGHGLPRGFVSRAQMRYFFANPNLRTRYAHKEAHKAGMYSEITKALGRSPRWATLPEHSHSAIRAAKRATRSRGR